MCMYAHIMRYVRHVLMSQANALSATPAIGFA